LGWFKTPVEAKGIFASDSLKMLEDVSFTAWGIFRGEARHIVESSTFIMFSMMFHLILENSYSAYAFICYYYLLTTDSIQTDFHHQKSWMKI